MRTIGREKKKIEQQLAKDKGNVKYKTREKNKEKGQSAAANHN